MADEKLGIRNKLFCSRVGLSIRILNLDFREFLFHLFERIPRGPASAPSPFLLRCLPRREHVWAKTKRREVGTILDIRRQSRAIL